MEETSSTPMSLRVECSQLVFGATFPNTGTSEAYSCEFTRRALRHRSDNSHLGSGVEFFQVPEPRTKLGRGIFPSPKAHMEGKSSEFFQVPQPREKLGIFLIARAYMRCGSGFF